MLLRAILEILDVLRETEVLVPPLGRSLFCTEGKVCFVVVTGAGSGGAPVVAVWDPFDGMLISQFMAYDPVFTGGVRVGVSDGNFDGVLDLITGPGPGGAPLVKGFSFPALDLLFSFFSGDPTNTKGVFVS